MIVSGVSLSSRAATQAMWPCVTARAHGLVEMRGPLAIVNCRLAAGRFARWGTNARCPPLPLQVRAGLEELVRRGSLPTC